MATGHGVLLLVLAFERFSLFWHELGGQEGGDFVKMMGLAREAGRWAF